jgi:hypothetical protein
MSPVKPKPILVVQIILTLLLATAAAPLWASTALTFDVVSHTEPAKGATETKGPSLPSDSHYALTVTLAGDTLQIDKSDMLTRYDFKKARIQTLDKSRKAYEEVSLYTVIGFDVVEFANRMMLAKVLAAAKMKDNPMAPALTEHLMSLSDPANATVIDRNAKGDEIAYSWNGQPLMTVSQRTREVSPAILNQYTRFLRYSTGGHPQILAAIGRGNGVPERLTVVRSNMGVETRTLTLQTIEERPDAPFSLEGYTRQMPDGEPYTILKRLSASPGADLEARVGVLRHEREAEAADGRLFDAMLANFAAMLSTGDQSEAATWVMAHHDQIDGNAEIQSLTRSLEPNDEASARTAVDTLEKLRQSAGSHAYVLNIFEGNIRFGLHESAKAVDLFVAALAADPTITSAWVDLGGFYYGEFRADAAWACWDAARSLRPTHFLLRQVDDREHKLRADHPEFF